MQASKENGTPPFRGSSHLPRVYLGPRHAGSAKYTEMTHGGWCTLFSTGLHPLGDQSGTPFSPEIPELPKSAQIWPQNRVPPLLTTFSASLEYAIARSGKKVQLFPPRGNLKGQNRTFGLHPALAHLWNSWNFPKPSFFLGGGSSPCCSWRCLFWGNWAKLLKS